MNTQPQILELYAQLEATYRRALDCAKHENWDEAAAIGAAAQAITSKLAALESGANLDAQGLKEKKERIEQTLQLVANLRSLVNPAHAESAALLSENTLRGKISNTYGV